MKNYFLDLVRFSLLRKLPRDEPTVSTPTSSFVNHTLPVKVFILTGQSNMQGHGRIWGRDVPGTVEYITKTEGRYPHLLQDENESWSTRSNVYTVYRNHDKERVGRLKVGAATEKGSLIGPELQIGHVLGHAFPEEQPILLIKVGTGNRALGWDFLPPGTPQRTWNTDEAIAGHGQCPGKFAADAVSGNVQSQCGCVAGQPGCNVFWDSKQSCLVDQCWCKSTNSCPKWYAGYQYDQDRENIRYVLDHLGDYIPDYQNQGFEVSGFFFWQGYSDSLNGAHAHYYRDNLVRYIHSMRQEFSTAPSSHTPPFVIATIGHFGCNEGKWTGGAKQVRDAQRSVMETERRVMTIDTGSFLRLRSESPLDDFPHYHRNANVFLEVGTKMGWAMADILQNQFRLEVPACR